MTKAVTITLDDAQAAELERAARESGLTVEALVAELLDGFRPLPPLTDEEKALIDRGREDVRANRVVAQEDMEKELRERFGR